MIAWGIIWGALLGLAIGRFDVEWLLFGALFGALAGGTLRRAVRSEWRRLADEISAPAVEQTPPTTPITAHATADVAVAINASFNKESMVWWMVCEEWRWGTRLCQQPRQGEKRQRERHEERFAGRTQEDARLIGTHRGLMMTLSISHTAA